MKRKSHFVVITFALLIVTSPIVIILTHLYIKDSSSQENTKQLEQNIQKARIMLNSAINEKGMDEFNSAINNAEDILHKQPSPSTSELKEANKKLVEAMKTFTIVNATNFDQLKDTVQTAEEIAIEVNDHVSPELYEWYIGLINEIKIKIDDPKISQLEVDNEQLRLENAILYIKDDKFELHDSVKIKNITQIKAIEGSEETEVEIDNNKIKIEGHSWITINIDKTQKLYDLEVDVSDEHIIKREDIKISIDANTIQFPTLTPNTTQKYGTFDLIIKATNAKKPLMLNITIEGGG